MNGGLSKIRDPTDNQAMIAEWPTASFPNGQSTPANRLSLPFVEYRKMNPYDPPSPALHLADDDAAGDVDTITAKYLLSPEHVLETLRRVPTSEAAIALSRPSSRYDTDAR